MKKIALFLVFAINLAVFNIASAAMPVVTAYNTNSDIKDGDLIKTSDNPDVYIVKMIGTKKFKRLILNPEIFNSYGHLKWSDIKTVDQTTEDSFKVSDLVIEVNSDGSVADPKVYRVSAAPNSDSGEKKWLDLSASEFDQAGFDWDSIYYINHTEASKSFYPEGKELKFTDVENENNDNGQSPTEPTENETATTTPDTNTGTTATTTPSEPQAPVVHRTTISVQAKYDSPSGYSITSSESVIGKFIVNNDLNAGDYVATVKNVGISLSGHLPALNGRVLRVYKDSVSSGNLLASYTYPDGTTDMYSPVISEADFTDKNVLANDNQTFVITLNTLGALSGDSLTVGVNSVTWSDGLDDNIQDTSGTTPLTLGVLSY